MAAVALLIVASTVVFLTLQFLQYFIPLVAANYVALIPIVTVVLFVGLMLIRKRITPPSPDHTVDFTG